MNRSIFQIWQPNVPKDDNTMKKLKTMNLNVGPQHPAAHGVLRLIVQLNGEIVEKIDPHVGLLHRGTEKLMEDKIYLHSLPYFDRFDYVSMLIQEHAYCLAIESLLGTINYSATFVQIRTLYDEITRILNHLLAIACHALDVGSMSPIFWAFEEREKLMEFYERVSGARMHAAFYRPNEVNLHSISSFLLEDMLDFSKNCFTTLNEMHNTLTYNKIWKQRLVNIGTYSYDMCINYGLTGVMARCTGIKRDLRLDKLETYANYYYLNFRSFIGQNGDSYDRFLIRMNEMTESLNIMNQVIYKLTKRKKKNQKKHPI
jgi:NADH:ubiquinone oxidoreductase subunit D